MGCKSSLISIPHTPKLIFSGGQPSTVSSPIPGRSGWLSPYPVERAHTFIKDSPQEFQVDRLEPFATHTARLIIQNHGTQMHNHNSLLMNFSIFAYGVSSNSTWMSTNIHIGQHSSSFWLGLLSMVLWPLEKLFPYLLWAHTWWALVQLTWSATWISQKCQLGSSKTNKSFFPNCLWCTINRVMLCGTVSQS